MDTQIDLLLKNKGNSIQSKPRQLEVFSSMMSTQTTSVDFCEIKGQYLSSSHFDSGVLECWSIGVLEKKNNRTNLEDFLIFYCQLCRFPIFQRAPFPLLHYSTTPLLHN